MKNTFTLPKSRLNVFIVFSLFMLCIFTITPVKSVNADCCHELRSTLDEAQSALEDAESALEDAEEAHEKALKTLREALESDDDDTIDLATERCRVKREAKEAAQEAKATAAALVNWYFMKWFWCFSSIHPYGFWLSGGCEECGGCN